MGLSWINPLYLTGALLLAIPLLIHLVQRQRSNGIRFPSLMFLQQIPLREKRRLEIRNWLLLLLRCLLLMLIVLAFARPFLTKGTGLVSLDPGRSDSIIVIDRSYSMGIADHWQQAQEIALELVAGKNAQDRIGIVAFDDNTEVLSDLTTNVANLRQVIERQKPGFKTTRLRLGLEQAARLLATSNASKKQIQLISDFQSSARDPGEPAIITRDIDLKTYAVNVTDAANSTILSAEIVSSRRNAADEYSLQVEIRNQAATIEDQSIRLVANGRQLAQRKLRMEPGATVVETFDNLNVSGDLVRAVVSLDDDAVALDNQVFFVYSSKQRVPILIVEGPQPRVNQSIYLENALKLSRDPLFSIKRLAWWELEAQDLAAWSVIIINDTSIPGGALGAALQDFVTAGGGLLVATGDGVQGNWPAGEGGLLPGTLLRRVDSKPGAAPSIGEIASDHPLVKDNGGSNEVDLSGARVFSYRNLSPNANDRLLARYSDGGVAILETTQHQGRVLVLTTTLDTHWNDLAVQPVFLPFLHQTLNYLAAFESYPEGFEIGSVVDVMRYARALAGGDAVVAAAADSTLIIETPGAGEIRLSRRSPLLTLTQPGFYQVHRATPASAEVVLAVNINPTEANLETLDVERFAEEIKASAEPPPSATLRQSVEYEQQQQLWYTVLSLVLVLMLVEAFSANWMVRNSSVSNRAKP